jgi:hypothetical protein
VLKFLAEFCHFCPKFFVTMTHFLELLFEAGIAVTGATLSAFLVMAFHFLGTSAESMRFIGEPGPLEVHGRSHEMGEGIGSTVFTLWFVTMVRAKGLLGLGSIAVRFFTPGHVTVRFVHAWTTFGATTFGATVFGATVFGATVFGATVFGATVFGATVFGTTAFGTTAFGATVFTATTFSRWAGSAFGLLPGGFFFGTRFGAGFFLLSLAGKAGESEGGGDGRTGEGAEEVCWAGDDHVGRYSIFSARVGNRDDYRTGTA